ncbi:hypothetical protein SF123566_3835 [Shigella flexneri 1235-66]|nr:hypothetical protein SF123566_3835 [Shigella flexneri 1235-66]
MSHFTLDNFKRKKLTFVTTCIGDYRDTVLRSPEIVENALFQ